MFHRSDRFPASRGTLRLAACFGLLALAPATSLAYTFVPSADEWETWPAYCRARYTTLEISMDTDFANRISASEVEHWKAVLGPAFLNVHHYCAGLVEFRQATGAETQNDRQFHLNQALGDAQYSFDRTELTNFLAPDMAALLAQIKLELGHPEMAEQVLQRVIVAQPFADRPYLVLSMIYRRQGNATAAVKILEQGNETTSMKSAEINYTLGLLYFEAKNYQGARACADRAYALGYPLPGLRNKLKKAGVLDD